MKFKTAFRNWYSTFFGALMMLAGLAMFIFSRNGKFDFSYLEMIMTAVVGWLFLMSKNDLIAALFAHLFKIKNKD